MRVFLFVFFFFFHFSVPAVGKARSTFASYLGQSANDWCVPTAIAINEETSWNSASGSWGTRNIFMGALNWNKSRAKPMRETR